MTLVIAADRPLIRDNHKLPKEARSPGLNYRLSYTSWDDTILRHTLVNWRPAARVVSATRRSAKKSISHFGIQLEVLASTTIQRREARA